MLWPNKTVDFIEVCRLPSNRRTHTGYQEGRRDAGSPLRFRGPRAMTLLDRSAPESLRQRNIPVLATERLILRAPCFEDARTIAALANGSRRTRCAFHIPMGSRMRKASSRPR